MQKPPFAERPLTDFNVSLLRLSEHILQDNMHMLQKQLKLENRRG